MRGDGGCSRGLPSRGDNLPGWQGGGVLKAKIILLLGPFGLEELADLADNPGMEKFTTIVAKVNQLLAVYTTSGFLGVILTVGLGVAFFLKAKKVAE